MPAHANHVGADDEGQQRQPVADEVEVSDDARPEHGRVEDPPTATSAVRRFALVDIH